MNHTTKLSLFLIALTFHVGLSFADNTITPKEGSYCTPYISKLNLVDKNGSQVHLIQKDARYTEKNNKVAVSYKGPKETKFILTIEEISQNKLGLSLLYFNKERKIKGAWATELSKTILKKSKNCSSGIVAKLDLETFSGVTNIKVSGAIQYQ